jgi:hypothetical protein
MPIIFITGHGDVPWKRNVENETAWNGRSWMVEELLRRSESLRLPAFTADQQFRRFAHGDVIVDNEDDWRDLQHLRSPHFMARCVHPNSVLHCGHLTDAPTVEGILQRQPNGNQRDEDRVAFHSTWCARFCSHSGLSAHVSRANCVSPTKVSATPSSNCSSPELLF